MCWVNNFRDLIKLQNALFHFESTWFNERSLSPAAGGYWGWNEIPIGREQISDPTNWDAVVIKMPLYVCGGMGGDDNLDCLTSKAETNLEDDLSEWVSKGKLVPGSENIAKRPGAYVVLLREWVNDDGESESWFFCQSWTSPADHWKLVYQAMSTENPTGACWLDHGSSFTSTALDRTFKPEVSRSRAKTYTRMSYQHVLV
jgi:hypothetical protein